MGTAGAIEEGEAEDIANTDVRGRQLLQGIAFGIKVKSIACNTKDNPP